MRKLPPTVYVLGAVSFFTDIASEMVYPLLPLFLTGVLGASTTVVGLVEGIAEATASLFKVVGGRISDRMAARKPLILLGYGFPALLRPILALAVAPWQVLAYRFLDRIGKGLRTAPRDALIAETVDQDSYGRAYGFHRAMDSLGATIGPLLAFLLLPLLDFRGVFWVSAIPALLATLVILFFLREKRGQARPLPPLRLSAFSLRYRWFLLVTGVATLGLSSNAFLILRLSDLGLSAAQATLVYTAYNLLYALMAYPLGSLADRVGARALVMLGFVTYALVYLGFGLSSAGWQGVVLFLLYALYSAAFEGSSRAYLAQIIPATEKASAIGLYHTLVGLLLLPASTLFGFLWQHFGSSLAFFTAASLAVAAVILFWLDPTSRRGYTS
ncbi:MAG: MFS transporter [Meiothermus sp.]|uniref:MFS transporter n=1 Tax=Meiothermus sp. TaxID=1955249 RepID=UPI0021DC9AD8|nr:MFS transporter [Meiothermus sp.]GIW27822.1 MAG: MFS transporter [Meiothermus sp.]